MNTFAYITTLEYRLKAANALIAAFESGAKYIRMQEKHELEVRKLQRELKKSRMETAEEHAHFIDMRNQWFDVFEDLQKQYEKQKISW